MLLRVKPTRAADQPKLTSLCNRCLKRLYRSTGVSRQTSPSAAAQLHESSSAARVRRNLFHKEYFVANGFLGKTIIFGAARGLDRKSTEAASQREIANDAAANDRDTHGPMLADDVPPHRRTKRIREPQEESQRTLVEPTIPQTLRQSLRPGPAPHPLALCIACSPPISLFPNRV